MNEKDLRAVSAVMARRSLNNNASLNVEYSVGRLVVLAHDFRHARFVVFEKSFGISDAFGRMIVRRFVRGLN